MDYMLFAYVLNIFFWQLIDKLINCCKLYQELKIVINLENSDLGSWSDLDKVIDHVTKTKFHMKIMKFVANFEKLVLGS